MSERRLLLAWTGVPIALLALGVTVISFASRRAVKESSSGGTEHVEMGRDKSATHSAPRESSTEIVKQTEDSAQVVDPVQLSEAIHSSARYLIRANDEDGKFVYRINLDPHVTPLPKYNMLRHAGTVYALAKYQQRYPSAEAVATLVRSSRWLKEKAVAEVPGRADLLAVWSDPEMTGGDGPLQAKLGGAGLALAALLAVEDVKPASTALDDLRGLGRFVLFMQKSDGSFYSKYIPEAGGRYDRWTSLYYPGEAALGLLMLYERDPSPEWLRGAAEAIAYLARCGADGTNIQPDHWTLLAIAELLPRYDRSHPPISREAVIKHAVQICERILADQTHLAEDSPGFGALAPHGLTCPTATRLEGLLAALSFLPREERELRKRITLAVSRGISFLLRAQVRDGEFAGGMPRAIRRLSAHSPENLCPFCRRATEVRIDYVQHAVCALMGYQMSTRSLALFEPPRPNLLKTVSQLGGRDRCGFLLLGRSLGP